MRVVPPPRDRCPQDRPPQNSPVSSKDGYNSEEALTRTVRKHFCCLTMQSAIATAARVDSTMLEFSVSKNLENAIPMKKYNLLPCQPNNVSKYRYILLERFPTDELHLLPETNGKFRVLLPTSDNISLYACSPVSLPIHPLRDNTAVSTSCQRETEVYTYTPCPKVGHWTPGQLYC